MPPTSVDDFAAQVRRYRRRSGLTQDELAERAGISAGSVSLMERGVTQAPQKATLRLLAAALALSPAEAQAFQECARAQRRHVAGATAGAEVLSSPPLDGNLPVPLTPLIGREDALTALTALLDQQTTRLLTLTGPAGVGKTRLALQVAATVRRASSQDFVFVGLIPVEEPERVPLAIAQALGIQDSGTVSLRDALVHALRERERVLVLDNFEQVLPAARGVLDLLIACPRLKALVTSRSALNVRGERCFPVVPLALPDAAQMDSLAELLRVPTVAFFLDRARAAWPDFTVTTLDEARLVAGICARLDGLPLAIELAAARVKHIGLSHLHDHLAEPGFLGLLTEGPQDLADHQRTMRSAIAWSYDLLAEEERRLFRWLGVFVGGARVDALQALTGSTDEAVFSGLTALVNAGLVQWADVAGTRRYTQLVTLRAYAQERLRAAAEWDDARRQHAGYFLELTQLIVHGTTDQPKGVLARLDIEYENVRAALAWALETGATWHGLRMVSTLRRLWSARAQFLEGLDWLERFVALAGSPTSRDDQLVLAQAWTGILVMAYRLDRFERAREAGDLALALHREVGDKPLIGGALNHLATVVTSLRDYDRARDLFEECLAVYREVNDRAGTVFPLLNLGELHLEQGNPHEALACYEESLRLSREMGESDWARALTWNNVGEICVILDEPARAIEVTEPSYHLFARERDPYGMATTAFTLGRAEWRLGQLRAARAHLDEADHLFRILGNRGLAARVGYFQASLALAQDQLAEARCALARALDDLASQPRTSDCLWWLVERAGTLVCREGAPQRAARLYAAALAHRDPAPRPIDPAERALRARDLKRLRATLGEPAWTDAVAEGAAFSLDDAIAALRDAVRIAPARPPGDSAPKRADYRRKS